MKQLILNTISTPSSVATSTNSMGVPDLIYDKSIEFFLNTPQAIATVIFSMFSGHMWAYILLAHYKSDDKCIKFIDGKTGKLALGLMWYAIVLLPVYFISNTSFNIEFEKVVPLIVPALLYGTALQAFIFTIIVWLKRG